MTRLLKNAWVHDGLGHVEKTDILLENGQIMKIAPNQTGEGEDLTGMHIFPGFVQALSNWGVNGSMQEIRPSADDNDEHSNPITPELDAFYAFNGRAASAQQLGAFGLTACGVAPTDNNLFGGTIAAFITEGVNPYKMCLRRSIGMMASVNTHLRDTYGKKNIAPMTRMWIFTHLADELRKAAEYKQEADKPEDLKLAALQKVTNGELPLFIVCDSKLAIDRVHEIVAAYPALKLVLVNGFGLDGSEDWLAEKDIPVIVRVAGMPMDRDAKGLDLNAIAKLMGKGVRVCLSGANTNTLSAREDLIWTAADMLRTGADTEKVLAMITSVPADILGIADQTGSVREGLRADLVIWSGNPLETNAACILETICGGSTIYRKGDEMKCM